MAILTSFWFLPCPLQWCTTCSLRETFCNVLFIQVIRRKEIKTEKVTLDIAGRLTNNSAVLKDKDLYLWNGKLQNCLFLYLFRFLRKEDFTTSLILVVSSSRPDFLSSPSRSPLLCQLVLTWWLGQWRMFQRRMGVVLEQTDVVVWGGSLASSSNKVGDGGGGAVDFNGRKWAQLVQDFKVLKFIDTEPHNSAPFK